MERRTTMAMAAEPAWTGPSDGTHARGVVPDMAAMTFPAFLQAHRDVPLTGIERQGDTYRLTVGEACCEADGSELADATLAEPVPGILLGSLLAAECAWDAGLPDAAIPGMLQAFRTGLVMGDSPAAALAYLQPKLKLALLVEGYVASPEGLMHDRAWIAHFPNEALRGRTGNPLLKALPPLSQKQRDLVTAYRIRLDRSLDDLIQSVREARESGDYELAADLMARFYQVCVEVTAARKWQERLHGHQAIRASAA